MRRSYNGLAAKVKMPLHGDPLNGHVFVFVGRLGNIIETLR